MIASYWAGSVMSDQNTLTFRMGNARISEKQPQAMAKRIFEPVAKPAGYSSTEPIVLSKPLPEVEPLDDFPSFQSAPLPVAIGAHSLSESDYLGMLERRAQPVGLDEMFQFFRRQQDIEGYDFAEIDVVLRAYFPSRDLAGVQAWIAEGRASERGLYSKIASGLRFVGEHHAATRWYQRAMIENGAAEDYFQVGAAKLLGFGTTSHLNHARMQLHHAMRKGHPEAGYLLGISYLKGFSTKGGGKEVHAYRLFQDAIVKGSVLAYGESGRMRELGIGVDKDLERAKQLYEQGAAKGDFYCAERLAALTGAHPSLMLEPSSVDEESWVRQEVRNQLPEEFR